MKTKDEPFIGNRYPGVCADCTHETVGDDRPIKPMEEPDKNLLHATCFDGAAERFMSELMSRAKRDDRPARGMWAPGNYLCTCTGCVQPFIGNKHSGLCADCAYGTTATEEDRREFQQDPMADLVRENTELRRTLAEMVELADRWISAGGQVSAIRAPEGKPKIEDQKDNHATDQKRVEEGP